MFSFIKLVLLSSVFLFSVTSCRLDVGCDPYRDPWCDPPDHYYHRSPSYCITIYDKDSYGWYPVNRYQAMDYQISNALTIYFWNRPSIVWWGHYDIDPVDYCW